MYVPCFQCSVPLAFCVVVGTIFLCTYSLAPETSVHYFVDHHPRFDILVCLHGVERTGTPIVSSAVLPSNSAPPLVPSGRLGMSSSLSFFSMGVSVEVGSKLEAFCSSDPVSSSGYCSAGGTHE